MVFIELTMTLNHFSLELGGGHFSQICSKGLLRHHENELEVRTDDPKTQLVQPSLSATRHTRL